MILADSSVASRAVEIEGAGRADTLVHRWAWPLILLFLAANLWAVAIFTFDRDTLLGMTDLGLAPLLPWAFYAAIASLLVGFALLLRSAQPPVALVVLYYATLIAVWHATPAILYATPRYPFTYKHIGISAYIQQYGSLDPNIDAYFNWPGFFALSAFASDISGLSTPFAEAIFAPILMNVFIVAGVVVLLHAFTNDKRVIWLGAWLYLLANWVGQDYFAPQAFAYALHLMILGVYVAWFVRRSWASPAPTAASTPWLRSAMLVFIVVAFAAVVASHQLTPFMTIASVGALIVIGLGRARLTLLVMVGLLLAWFSYMAQTYFAGHLGSLLSSVGRLLENFTIASQVLAPTDAASLSAERLLVLDVRQWLTLLVAALAAVGWLRRVRGRHREWVPVVLMLVPAAMVALQPYGGEIIMRIFLFSVPVLAYFAARAFFPARTALPARGVTVGIILATTSLAAGMTVAYFGNESMNYVAPDELQVLDELYTQAVAGSLIVTQTDNAPIKHRRYQEFVYSDLSNAVADLSYAGDAEELDSLARALTDNDYEETYLLFTRSQGANARLFGRLTAVDWDTLRADLDASPGFETLYANDGGSIYRVVSVAEEQAP